MDNKESVGADMPIKFESTRINLFHVGAIVVAIIANTAATVTIYNTLTTNDEKAKTDNIRLEARMATIEAKMPEVSRLDDKITRLVELIASNSKAIEEVNKRADRIVESNTNKLDVIISRQSDQSADIKVIQSQLAEQQRTQRTRFTITQPNLRSVK